MPKPDDCHYQVARALQNDGWQIIHHNWYIDDDFSNAIYIDMVASRQDNGSAPITVYIEAKCFDSPRSTPELHRALGQTITYRVILDWEGFTDPLYLAVPLSTYEEYFNEGILAVVKAHKIKLVVVDLDAERIVEWKP